MTTEKKIKKDKYFRVHNDQFKEWIVELMQRDYMKYASAKDVAEELSRVYGGAASSHLYKIYDLRIKIDDYRPPKTEK